VGRANRTGSMFKKEVMDITRPLQLNEEKKRSAEKGEGGEQGHLKGPGRVSNGR